MTIRLICIDADDTLWHNMRHFNATEDALFDMLRPFVAASAAREALRQCELRNLPIYGYGVKGFTLSMIETALELCGDKLKPEIISGVLALGRSLLAHPIQLFEGIDETLRKLAERGRLILVTKGDLLHQETKIAASGLEDHFSGIEIVSDKNADTFGRLFARYEAKPHETIIAGDSMRSDILPALKAGAWAAYIPQQGAWAHESALPPDDDGRYTSLESFTELPNLIDRINLI